MPYSIGTISRGNVEATMPAPRRQNSGSIPRSARYQRIGQMMIRPLVLGGQHCAFDLARMFYAQYANLSFMDDMAEYLRNGYVISQPNLFGLFRPIEHEGRRGWFIRIAIGEIGDLIRYFPCPLAFVAFVRNNDDDMRIIEWDAFMETVGKMSGYKKEKT